MRYAIFADIHANMEALEATLGACKKESVDSYFCAGDIVGYGAEPHECIEKVKSGKITIVAGNHDWAAVDLYSAEHFNPLARQAILWTKSKLSKAHRDFLQDLKLVFTDQDLTLVHGTLDHPQDFNYLSDGFIAEETFRLQETRVCFLGHTHVPGIFIKESDGAIHYGMDSFLRLDAKKRYIVNVGSVGQPRDANPMAAYCIYDSEEKEVRIKRVSYDIDKAKDKIISAGLPALLGERLLSGR